MSCKILAVGLVAGMAIGGLAVANKKMAKELLAKGKQKVKKATKAISNAYENVKDELTKQGD